MLNNLWYASRRTQISIDWSEGVSVEYPVCVISVAQLLNDAYFFQSLLCFTIEGVYLYLVYFSKLKYRVLESVSRLTMWLQKTLEGFIVCFLNWDS